MDSHRVSTHDDELDLLSYQRVDEVGEVLVPIRNGHFFTRAERMIRPGASSRE